MFHTVPTHKLVTLQRVSNCFIVLGLIESCGMFFTQCFTLYRPTSSSPCKGSAIA